MRKLYFIFFALLPFGFVTASSWEPMRTNAALVEKMETTVSLYYPSPICANSYEVPVIISGTGNYLGGTFSAESSGLYINSVTGTINPFLSLPGTYYVIYSIPANVSTQEPALTVFTTLVISEGAYVYTSMSDMNMCDYDGVNNGHMLYPQCPTSNLPSLAGYVSSILGSQDPATHIVEFYFNSAADAEAGNSANALTNLDTYEVQTGTYYVRVENTVTGCYDIDTFSILIRQLAVPFISSNTASNIGCVDWNSTTVMNGLVLNSGITAPNYTFEWYVDGVLIAGETGPTLAVTAMNGPIVVYTVKAIDSLGCESVITANSTFVVQRSGPASVSATADDLQGMHTVTLETAGYGIYLFSMDGITFQESPVFSNLPVGAYVFYIADANGCSTEAYTVLLTDSPVPAPDGSNDQNFAPGATLADIVVSGTNITWYASAGGNKVAVSGLPLSTPLVDGATYYATQTVGGIESTSRLPVTVHLGLGVADNHALALTYSPNPVKSGLHLKAIDTITRVSVMNLLGQVLMTSNYNQTEVTQDLSGFEKGTYFIKVLSEDKVKVITILKD